MATVRISQLTAITAPTDDDVLIINDADTNTRKITYANLTQSLLNTSATAQTKSGALTVAGTLTASNNFVVDTNTFFVDSVSNRVGIRNTAPATELDIDGDLHLRNEGGIQFGDANDSNYISLKAPSTVVANYGLTLPGALPASTSLLTSTAAGQLGFSTGIVVSSGTLSLSTVELADQGSVRFYEASGNGSEYVSFGAPGSLSSTTSYQLPASYPVASGYVLASSTTGTLSWVSNAAGAAGADSQVQFATAGVLDASANFTFQTSTNLLTVSNATITGALTAQGNTTLGDTTADTITINGLVGSSIVPSVTSTYDLGTNLLRFEDSFLENVDFTGTMTVGGVFSGDIVPSASSTDDLGSSVDRFAELHADDHYTGVHALEKGYAQAAVASAGTFVVNLGAAATYGSFKVLIQAVDDVTGDREFYEHVLTHDGTTVQEMTGSNVQSPAPGTFLTTPSTAIGGGNVNLTLTNSAVSGNAVSIRVLATSLAV